MNPAYCRELKNLPQSRKALNADHEIESNPIPILKHSRWQISCLLPFHGRIAPQISFILWPSCFAGAGTSDHPCGPSPGGTRDLVEWPRFTNREARQ